MERLDAAAIEVKTVSGGHVISLLSDFVVDFMYSMCSDQVEGQDGKRDRLCCVLIVLTICLHSRHGHNSKEQINLYIVL